MVQGRLEAAHSAASAGDRRHPRRDVRHAGRAVRAAGDGARPAEAEDGGRARRGATRRERSTACIAATAPIATASPATATGPRRRFSIRIRATTGRASSSSRARTIQTSRPTRTCTRRCINGIPARRCLRSAILPPDEVAAMLEYVKYLSMRGQMETVAGELRVRQPRLRPDDRRRRRRSIRRTTGPAAAKNHGPVGRRRRGEVAAGRGDRGRFRKTRRCRPMHRTAAEMAASVKAGRELFYGTQGQLREVPRADGTGRRPAGRLRHLEQGRVSNSKKTRRHWRQSITRG